MTDRERLLAAYTTSRDALLDERHAQGHWVGRLSSSPLSTATAICALVLAEEHARGTGQDFDPDELYQSDLSEQLLQSLYWLAGQQNEDGGWGDTDESLSNIATTMLAVAAFRLTGVPAKYADLLERADAYIKQQGGIRGLKRRYGRDKTFAVPILTNCALAETISWRKVRALPFELACLPQSVYRFLRFPVVSYAIPALVAVGQARFHNRPPLNPITRFIRRLAVKPSLDVLAQMQPESGGYLEATPLTSFVVMSLAGMGQAESAVVRRGVEFLLASVRPDGSWPIDTNLATWNTSLAVNALHNAGEDLSQLDCLDWLLSCQHTETHRSTGAAPGGWAWTDLSGGVPDSDDTSSALLALAAWYAKASGTQRQQIAVAARAGVAWLLDLQNRDGGWPTFCRGWGRLPFDRSGCDLTAHAVRALHTWHAIWRQEPVSVATSKLASRLDEAIEAGFVFLDKKQQHDGSWLPLWFGNQHQEQEANPIYGTAKVLLAYRDCERLDSPAAHSAQLFLLDTQQADGGWGAGPSATENGFPAQASTLVETSLAVEALLAGAGDTSLQTAIDQGLAFLVEAVEQGRLSETPPIGLYFAKLWYHERLYGYVHTVSALGQALRRDPMADRDARQDEPHLSRV